MTTWGDKLQGISKAKLNSLAAAEFAAKTVYAACEERAALGFSWAEIRPSIPVNVQECEAVKALLEGLAKEKVRHEWVPLQDGPDAKYFALRISWEKPIK
jgi:hypothetical protein